MSLTESTLLISACLVPSCASVSDYPDSPLTLNTLFQDRYLICQLLASGKKGYLYLCQDQELDNFKLALRYLPTQDPASFEMRALLRSEIASSYLVSHPNILRTFDFFCYDDFCFCTMEYLDQGTLEHWLLKREKVDLNQAIKILQNLCAALDTLHQAGISYPNFSAGKVLLGLGQILKIFAYHKELNQKAEFATAQDIFCFGKLAYYLVSGKQFPEKNSAGLILAPHQINPECPKALSATILRSLAPDPELRQHSFAEIFEELNFISRLSAKPKPQSSSENNQGLNQ